MIALIESLFLIPIAVSALLLLLPKTAARFLTILATLVLSAIAIYLFTQATDRPIQFAVSPVVNKIVMIADFSLLLFVIGAGLKQKNILVWVLAILQLLVLGYLTTKMSETQSTQFYVDKLSIFMFILVNVISGVIAVYSLKYIDEEKCSWFRKKYFISMIFWFMAAMNLLAAADNLEYFYLFFELTTLASYLFIRFRKDDEKCC